MSLKEKLMNAKTSSSLFDSLSDLDRKKNRVFAQISLLIRRCRKQANLGQTDLAKKLKVSQPVISKLESGDTNISIGRLIETFDALGYDVDFSVKERTSTRTKTTFDGCAVVTFLPAMMNTNLDVKWNQEVKGH